MEKLCLVGNVGGKCFHNKHHKENNREIDSRWIYFAAMADVVKENGKLYSVLWLKLQSMGPWSGKKMRSKNFRAL